jgi:hypothetical protein
VLEQMRPEVLLQDEQILLELVLHIVSVGFLDALFPHAHEFPGLELLEEGEVLDVIVRVSLDEPLAEGEELYWGVSLIEGQSIARDGVVVVTLLDVSKPCVLQVIWVILAHGLKVHEHGLLVALGVEEKLDELVELGPGLGLLGLLVVFLRHVGDDVSRDVIGLVILLLLDLKLGLRALRCAIEGRQGLGWQLASELVQEELAPGLLQILLRHGGASFEASVDEGWWALHDPVRIDVHGASRLVELLLDLRLVGWVEWLHLGSLPVEELAGHTGLADGDSHAGLDFLADVAWLDVVGLGHNDVLLSVVVGIGGTKILGVLKGSLAVAVIEIGDDFSVEILDLFLEWR